MSARTAFAPGKIILTGEYAVVFGEPGLAVPSGKGLTAVFSEDLRATDLIIEWPGVHPQWLEYTSAVVDECLREEDQFIGTLQIACDLPLGRGMGSSTAAVIAVTRALLGDNCERTARRTEDVLNPGNSGIDFAVIWRNAAVEFRRDEEPKILRLEQDLLGNALLIDTGAPNEQTPELVSWMRGREAEAAEALRAIGRCTERLIAGEDVRSVLRDHHRAQVELGVVPDAVQEMVMHIEMEGGAAKVIGAGGRAGGAGMVLALHDNAKAIRAAIPDGYDTLPL